MNGADALLSTLLANEITTCFANPGTSEMQFVAALDRNTGLRPVLCLFEDVATGAADKALWTLARENLDVSVLVFANNGYRILDIEMRRTGSGQAGPRAAKLGFRDSH